MNKGLWIARKNYLLTLIKKLSDYHGGDDKEFLESHCKETIEAHLGETIELAIRCYEDILKELQYPYEPRKPKTHVNQGIVYRAPFISHIEVSSGKD